MPKYRCHKVVHALKIQSVGDPPTLRDGSRMLRFVDEQFAPRWVPAAYVLKHTPHAGGYFVVYDDGYESWSPGDAFEAGYTRIEN